MERDKDLDSLRGREDFKKVMQSLQTAKPEEYGDRPH
jgi:hypothetical protein